MESLSLTQLAEIFGEGGKLRKWTDIGIEVPGCKNQECVAPSVSSAVDGSYPIARPLFIYTNGKPAGVIKGYLDWILSDEGQCIIYKKGYAPVSAVKCKRRVCLTGIGLQGIRSVTSL